MTSAYNAFISLLLYTKLTHLTDGSLMSLMDPSSYWWISHPTDAYLTLVIDLFTSS